MEPAAAPEPLTPADLEALPRAARTLEVVAWQLSRLLPRDEPTLPPSPIVPS